MKNKVKKLTKQVLIVAIVLLFIINKIMATPSTIIWIPSVDFQIYKTCHLGIDNYIRTEKINGIRGAGVYDMGLTFGVSPFKKFKAELGIDYLSMGDYIYDDNPLYFNAKVGIQEDSLFKYCPAFVIGGYNLGIKDKLTNYNLMYGLVAKTLPFVGRFSVGYYYGNEKLLLDDKGSIANSGILVSWDRQMNEISKKLWLAVDYQGGKNYLGALSVGFSWLFSDNVSVIFGYDVYNNTEALYNSFNKNANTFTTQLDINF